MEKLLKAPESQPYLNANQGEGTQEPSKDRLYHWWHGITEFSDDLLKKVSGDDSNSDLLKMAVRN